MKQLLAVAIMLTTALYVSGAGLPLTTREVALMLRSGYSSETVIRELQQRRFGDLIGASDEKQLAAAGASSALIEALRSGSYQASDTELEAAEAKLAAAERDQIEARRRLRGNGKFGGKGSAPSPRESTDDSNTIQLLLKDSLISLRQGAIAPFDDTELQSKKFYLFFFSANWSPDGRKFTPQLIDYYNRVKTRHPEFEVIFFSADRSQFGMETYFHDSGMPWPAVAYPKLNATAAGMETTVVKTIPALVFVDRSGNVLSQTGGESDPKSPDRVLADVDAVLMGTKSRVAGSQD